MKLNDELYELGKNNIGICKVIDNDYVLITKKMPVPDKMLDSYILAINNARDAGINVCEISDYKLIEENSYAFDNERVYSNGVFIERRAKGNSFNFTHFELNNAEEKEVIKGYINSLEYYIDEIEKRSEASEKVYDKLIEDVFKLQDFGLEIDPKPLNFFYSKEEGYSIIDVIPVTKVSKREFFPQNIKSIVFGYEVPRLYLDYNDISMMPLPLYDRYEKAKNILLAKIETSLLRHGFKEEELSDFERIRNEKNPEIVDYVDLIDYVENKKEEHKGYKI